MACIVEVGPDLENASELLAPYIQSGSLNFLIGSGASFPAIGTAGNIEAEINALLALDDIAGANTKSLEFIETIGDVHAKLIGNAADAAIAGVIESYRNFAATVDAILFARKSLLLPRQAAIFTTNYDLFLEAAASRLPGLILNDGFDRTSGLGSTFHFAPERYFDRTYRSGPLYGRSSEIPTINLIKLHGSLSWQRQTDSLVYKTDLPPKLSAADRGDPTKVEAYLAQHFLILPNVRKFHATLMDRVYYDLLRMFSKAMDQENALLIAFGFSFADEHILDLTRRSLRNPTSQLIVMSYDKPSAAAYHAKFANHRNVTIIEPGPGANIDFSGMNRILQGVLPEEGK